MPLRYHTREVISYIFSLLFVIFALVSSAWATEEQHDSARILRSLNSSVVFDSNQSRDFGIYEIVARETDPPTLERRVVVNSSGHEIMPSVSPDHRQVVYARGNRPDRGTRFDIWIVDRTARPSSEGVYGSNPRKLVENGATPTFHSDGKKVIFEREQRFVMSLDLKSGVIEQLFDSQKTEFGSHQIFLPNLSPDGNSLALTSTLNRRYTNYLVRLSNLTLTKIGHGCQPNWSTSGKNIFWIADENAQHKTKVMKYDVQSGANTEIFDGLPPRGVPQETHMVYSAARLESNYLKGDYQVFLRDLQNQKSARLTFDSFNNRWPKFAALLSE
jgi:Tol biopolymer transport system component